MFIRFLLINLGRTVIYCLLILGISILFVFGLLTTILPQPIIEVSFGRWTVWFNILDLKSILWFFYIWIMHIVLYYVISILAKKAKRPYLFVGTVLYLVNLALVLIGLSSLRYRLLVLTYSIRFGGALLGILITIGIEYIAYRVFKNSSYGLAR